VWNQSVTRTRWLATKLGGTVLAAAAAVGLLSLAVTWWAAPLDGSTGATRESLPARLTPVAFAMRGIVPIGYAVFALVLGVAVGMVLRRAVPAMAVTLLVFTGVQVAVPLLLRPHLAPPVRQTVTIADHLDGVQRSSPGAPLKLTVTIGSPDAWTVSQATVDPSGRVLDAAPAWLADCLPEPGRDRDKGTLRGCLDRLDSLGYRQQVVYQPADRFWRLQWTETGLFLGVSALLAWFCFWWVRRLS
jgi:hypothetical protein